VASCTALIKENFVCTGHLRGKKECRVLGFKNLVRTSQETHRVSATETSRLMLCKIRSYHGGDYEECRRVALVGADDSIASIIRVKQIGELGTTLTVISKRCRLR
jgi:hypothetical protein